VKFNFYFLNLDFKGFKKFLGGQENRFYPDNPRYPYHQGSGNKS